LALTKTASASGSLSTGAAPKMPGLGAGVVAVVAGLVGVAML
jgi:hypothetical protein